MFAIIRYSTERNKNYIVPCEDIQKFNHAKFRKDVFYKTLKRQKLYRLKSKTGDPKSNHGSISGEEAEDSSEDEYEEYEVTAYSDAVVLAVAATKDELEEYRSKSRLKFPKCVQQAESTPPKVVNRALEEKKQKKSHSEQVNAKNLKAILNKRQKFLQEGANAPKSPGVLTLETSSHLPNKKIDSSTLIPKVKLTSKSKSEIIINTGRTAITEHKFSRQSPNHSICELPKTNKTDNIFSESTKPTEDLNVSTAIDIIEKSMLDFQPSAQTLNEPRENCIPIAKNLHSSDTTPILPLKIPSPQFYESKNINKVVNKRCSENCDYKKKYKKLKCDYDTLLIAKDSLQTELSKEKSLCGEYLTLNRHLQQKNLNLEKNKSYSAGMDSLSIVNDLTIKKLFNSTAPQEVSVITDLNEEDESVFQEGTGSNDLKSNDLLSTSMLPVCNDSPVKSPFSDQPQGQIMLPVDNVVITYEKPVPFTRYEEKIYLGADIWIPYETWELLLSSKKDHGQFIMDLAQTVWGVDTLVQRSVTGKKNTKKVALKALTPEKVAVISAAYKKRITNLENHNLSDDLVENMVKNDVPAKLRQKCQYLKQKLKEEEKKKKGTEGESTSEIDV